MKPRRILVANRGEIALRVIRACREMGHVPLAVYSKADRKSLHVTRADAAYCVGEGPSLSSYLNIDNILKAARALRADAIHPGYGFLSEKPEFAERVEQAGLIFIGPSKDVIAKMGDKVMARKTMSEVGHLPLVPGTREGLSDPEEALRFAREIGFPVMIKALAGGGGRGMRLVLSEQDFVSAFHRAYSEAMKAFGDGRLYLEKFVSSPHHIEVQILADHHGNVLHLFDRECSVQRRYQKLIEEAPSPFLSQETRRRICEAAVKACELIGYYNAGTIEFLMDEHQNFYFMEMNTRLQVEHPVTEWITGVDIVKEQIRIAFGERISFSQEELEFRGHAIEFRVNAEDPEKLLPQVGLVHSIQFPTGVGIRVDSHLYRGYEIPVFYDSMIAKVSCWGRSRDEAIRRSKAALRDTIITGVQTNLPLHFQILENERFLSGNYTTRLIGEDFHFKAWELSKEEQRRAAIMAAIASYRREYHRSSAHEETSLWKAKGRLEGLR